MIQATAIKQTITVDPLHDRLPGDVLIAVTDQCEYVVVEMGRSLMNDICYLVRPYAREDAPTTWMRSVEFLRN